MSHYGESVGPMGHLIRTQPCETSLDIDLCTERCLIFDNLHCKRVGFARTFAFLCCQSDLEERHSGAQHLHCGSSSVDTKATLISGQQQLLWSLDGRSHPAPIDMSHPAHSSHCVLLAHFPKALPCSWLLWGCCRCPADAQTADSSSA